MEVKIKSIGEAKGTVGWLAKGLESGELYLEEGTLSRNGNHGLWLESKTDPKVTTFLAAFNQYGLTASECAEANRYTVADDFFQGQWGSDAFWFTLRTIAKQWCDECNAALEADEAIEIKIVRTAQEVAA